MVKIEFIKSFANHKKGDVIEIDSMIASSLKHRKIAKMYKAKKSKK